MKILVLNPNGSADVTATIKNSVSLLAAGGRHDIDFDYLPQAPLGIETDGHVAEVAPMVVDAVSKADADVVVVACFSDPGVAQARDFAGKPVIGIAEAAYYACLQLAPRFGVVSLGASSVARHAAHIGRLGLSRRLAADLPVDMTVAEAGDPHSAGASVLRAARSLRDEHGAGAVILGCAGMGGHRTALQRELGIPVVDPVQAAVAAATTMLDLNYHARS